MTLYQFNLLPEHEQYTTLWDKGVFIAERILPDYKYLRYQLDSFYSEIKCDYKENKIESLRTFVNTSQLEPYLPGIAIDSLFGQK